MSQLPDTWTELTPSNKRCMIGACPAIFKNDRGQLVVIGRLLSMNETESALSGRIGPDEVAIEISPEFFADLGSI
jgi:hypothetical protein